MDQRTLDAADWLLSSEEAAVRLMTRRDVLGEQPTETVAEVLAGPKVSALLSGQQPDGGFGGHPYKKWTGAHWRLVSLVELEIPAKEPRTVAAANQVLTWLTASRRRGVAVIDGLARRCGSIEGNALAVCSRLGLTDDPRVQGLAEGLLEWQWPDGGWNCDKTATGRRSSFHETHAAAWGLHEYAVATSDTAAHEAAVRAADLFLEHKLFRSLTTGEAIDRRWLEPRYPPYWHYDILQALLVLSRLGLAGDPRAADALDEVERQRLEDGRWKVRLQWWKPAGGPGTREVVDWGRSGPNEMVTLNALRVLRAAGR
ncbi:MAG TPA: hypothetical protein VFT31_05720 [Kribbella sp.]|nr:hypothetical protein [Kribbella sp.]